MRLRREIAACLQLLSSGKDFLTATDVSTWLSMPKTKAYSLITECDFFLRDHGIDSGKVSNKAIIRVSSKEDKKALRDVLNSVTPQEYDYSSHERRAYIFFRLLEGSCVRNQELCDVLKISRNTCINDVAQVSEFIDNEKLNIKIISSSKGYVLGGEEREIRRTCFKAIGALLTDNRLFTDSSMNTYGTHIYSILGFDYENIKESAKKLKEVADKMNVELSFPSCIYTEFLYLIVKKRICNGFYLSKEDDKSSYHTSENLKWLFYGSNENLSEELTPKKLTDEDKKRKVLMLELEELQRMCICAASVNEEHPEKCVTPDAVLEEARRLLQGFRTVTAIPIEEPSLVRVIAGLIEGARLRNLYGYYLVSNGDERLKEDYRFLYDAVNKVVSQSNIIELDNDWEKESLLMQIIGILLNYSNSKEGTDSKTGHTIGVVCFASIGTGALIKEQLIRYIPSVHVKILDHYSPNIKEADLIVTSMDIEPGVVPVIKVRPLLTHTDIRILENVLSDKLSGNDTTDDMLSQISECIAEFADSSTTKEIINRISEIISKFNIQTNKKGAILKELITQNRVQCLEKVADWKEALRVAANPLLKDGSIEESYIDAMIGMVEKYGPYFILAPGLALPHARPEDGVNKLGMALLKLNHPVSFEDGDEDHYANLFFVLASNEPDAHINAMKDLSRMFMSEDDEQVVINRYIDAKDETELWNLLG